MGIADRDYAREVSRPPVGSMQVLSVTTWLIIINVAVFIVDKILAARGLGYVLTVDGQARPFHFLEWWGHFSVELGIKHLQLWRLITFQFLHDQRSIGHILFNMFSLYFFGPVIEGYLGRRRFLAFYLLCGIGGPIAYVLFWGSGVWGTTASSWTPLVGASAGIFGVLVAAARIAPDSTVLIYGSIPAKLKTVAWVLLGVAVYTVFTSGRNAGGEAAHLGGAAVGFFLIARPKLLNLFETGYRSGRRRMTYR